MVLRLLRWLLSVASLAAVIWFCATVELDGKTTIEHLRAIARTKESQALGRAIAHESLRVAERIQRSLGGHPANGGSAPQIAEPSPASSASPSPPAPTAPPHAEPAAHPASPPDGGHAHVPISSGPPAEHLDPRDRAGLDKVVRDHAHK